MRSWHRDILCQIICRQYHDTTMVTEVNCSVSAAMVVLYWKIKYSSKSLIFPNSFRNGRKKITATAVVLPSPRKPYNFTSVTTVVPWYYLQMIWQTVAMYVSTPPTGIFLEHKIPFTIYNSIRILIQSSMHFFLL